jgi:hypothetical protein
LFAANQVISAQLSFAEHPARQIICGNWPAADGSEGPLGTSLRQQGPTAGGGQTMTTILNSLNGSTAATVVNGAGLKHRDDTACQRAARAVQWYRGLVAVRPSQRMAIEVFEASASYFRSMLHLPEDMLQAITEGRNHTPVRELPTKTLALPAAVAPVNGTSDSDQVRALVERIGIDALLNTAATIEMERAA